MKLDRNGVGGLGKYAILNLRKLEGAGMRVRDAVQVLADAGLLEFGGKGDPNEFFVMMLKDVNTHDGLVGYASKAAETDPEYASEVLQMATRAAMHPGRKIPD